MTESTPSADEVFSAAARARFGELGLSDSAIGRLEQTCAQLRCRLDEIRQPPLTSDHLACLQQIRERAAELHHLLGQSGSAWRNLVAPGQVEFIGSVRHDLAKLGDLANSSIGELKLNVKRGPRQTLVVQSRLVFLLFSDLTGEKINTVHTTRANASKPPFLEICTICFEAIGLNGSAESAIARFLKGRRELEAKPTSTTRKPKSTAVIATPASKKARWIFQD